ncbi:MAG: hypothetical protein J6Y94_02115 [Bacteriovoracaceae bacterium]|nr:hypothetical protein [Bacteriovoracaceae bacterium]
MSSLMRSIMLGVLVFMSWAAQATLDQRPWPFYFLPEKYRQVAMSEIPLGVLETSYRQMVEAINTVTLNAQYPLRVSTKNEVNRQQYYFVQINKEIKQINPEAKLYLGPATWQAILYGIMATIHQKVLAGDPAEQVIDGIIKGKIKVDPSLFLGVGQQIELIVLVENMAEQASEIHDRIKQLAQQPEAAVLKYTPTEAVGERLPISSTPDVYFFEMPSRGSNKRIPQTILNVASYVTMETSAQIGMLYFSPSFTEIDPPKIQGHSRTEYGFSVSNSVAIQDYLQGLASGFVLPLAGSNLASVHGSVLRTMREYQQMPWLRISTSAKDVATFKRTIDRYLKVQSIPEQDLEKIRQEIILARMAKQGDQARRKMRLAAPGTISHAINQMYESIVQRGLMAQNLPVYVDQFSYLPSVELPPGVEVVRFAQLPSSTKKMVADLKVYPTLRDAFSVRFALEGRYEEQQKTIKVNNKAFTLTGLIGHKNMKDLPAPPSSELSLAINPQANFKVLLWPKVPVASKDQLLQDAAQAGLKIDDDLAEKVGADVIIWNDTTIVLKNTTPLQTLNPSAALAWQCQRIAQLAAQQTYLVPYEWQQLLDLSGLLRAQGRPFLPQDINLVLPATIMEIADNFKMMADALQESPEIYRDFIYSFISADPTLMGWAVHPEIWLTLNRPEINAILRTEKMQTELRQAFYALPVHRVQELWPTLLKIIPAEMITQYYQTRIQNLSQIAHYVELKLQGMEAKNLNASLWDEVQRFGPGFAVQGDLNKTKEDLAKLIKQGTMDLAVAAENRKVWGEILDSITRGNNLAGYAERKILDKAQPQELVLLSAKGRNQDADNDQQMKQRIIRRHLANLNKYLASPDKKYSSIISVMDNIQEITQRLRELPARVKKEKDYLKTVEFIERIAQGECSLLFLP